MKIINRILEIAASRDKLYVAEIRLEAAETNLCCPLTRRRALAVAIFGAARSVDVMSAPENSERRRNRYEATLLKISGERRAPIIAAEKSWARVRA